MTALRAHRRFSYAMSGVCFIAFCYLLAWLVSGCGGTPVQTCAPEVYSARLATCTAVSDTLAQSITCENEVRAACGRPLRLVEKDGGR